MEEITQEETIRDNQVILLKDVLNVIKSNFDFIHTQIKGRRLDEQTIIGDTLTTLELEIKKEIKEIKIINQ